MRREQGAARLNREHPIRRGGRGVGDAGRVALREERADACALEDGGRLDVSSVCARARKAGGRSFAGHGARQDFPFFLVRNNRRFAGKDKFPFLAQTVLFLQARRGRGPGGAAGGGAKSPAGRLRPERQRRPGKIDGSIGKGGVRGRGKEGGREQGAMRPETPPGSAQGRRRASGASEEQP